MSLAFLACIEPGRLESEVLLLCGTIREFAGRFADAPIHVYQPRVSGPLRRETIAQLERLRVERHIETLNVEVQNYAIGNKIFAAADAEQRLREDTLVFFDSDTVVVNEPSAFALDAQVDVALRPVDQKLSGSTGPADGNDAYWRRLYALCGIDDERFVHTTLDGERVRAYYNAGLVCVRRSAGLFDAWRDHFRRLVRARHIPGGGMRFVDQLALAAAVTAHPSRAVSVFDVRYNYPLPLRPRLPRDARETPLSTLVHLHYHRWFHHPGYLQAAHPDWPAAMPAFAYVAGRLPLSPAAWTASEV
jgi:hypothetical protein